MSLWERRQPASSEESDPLTHALDALRKTRVPDGPASDVIERTLAALDVSATAPDVQNPRRRKIMLATLKVAAALLAAAVGGFLITSSFSTAASVTFAEVAEKMQKAHSFAYTMTGEVPGGPKQPAVRLFYKEPGHMRTETLGALRSVLVCDLPSGTYLMLNPAAKTAVLLEGKLPGTSVPGTEDMGASTVNHFRKLGDRPGKPVGEKQIGGVLTRGFHVEKEQGYDIVVWANPQTKLPVALDISSPFGDQTMHGTITDIQLDPELDDSLFRIEPPEGYKLIKQSLGANLDKKDDGSPEAAIVYLLRAYAENAQGTFPKRFDNWLGYSQALQKKYAGQSPESIALELGNLFARAQAFAMSQKKSLQYRPDNVKLGDGDKPLLWHKLAGKETYRVIYGDLHAADVAADPTPTAPKP